eukprot:5463700-Lingulodinium_polyedra.AAC.1
MTDRGPGRKQPEKVEHAYDKQRPRPVKVDSRGKRSYERHPTARQQRRQRGGSGSGNNGRAGGGSK